MIRAFCLEIENKLFVDAFLPNNRKSGFCFVLFSFWNFIAMAYSSTRNHVQKYTHQTVAKQFSLPGACMK